ncbi:Fic family protein [Aquiflexum sp.]|uniref:Fic family protein n=1 Tax=Aquiflexum sp. TaxID=1872584 RepID=UPI003593BC19
MPQKLTLFSTKKRQYQTENWAVYTSRHKPDDTLNKHLVFALKYEGINLLFFRKLFDNLSESEVIEIIQFEPLGQYSRRIWFLFEWLMQKSLAVENLSTGNFIPIIEDRLQFGIKDGPKSSRHRIINNLPGTVDFCPLIFRTEKLEGYSKANFAEEQSIYLSKVRKDILQRASSFLLLKDSKASFTIEGESPKSKRAARWGQTIGQAGMRNLSKEELLRLQQLVIENPRFLELGFRKKGGFVGEHDRITVEPIPDHISAKWQDIEILINGLLETEAHLVKSEMDPVLVATAISFGFVFIHPFEDGNGRIHRYLIHHILSKMNFSQQGIILPVSAAILDKINDYRKVLESYSIPLMDIIQWEETKDHNLNVLNQTVDYYRYFDATKQAEFLYECVEDTIHHIIPEEVDYLTKYDEFKRFLEDEYEMPDKLISLLLNFLEQNNGILSKRARENEYKLLTDGEVIIIQNEFARIFEKD